MDELQHKPESVHNGGIGAQPFPPAALRSVNTCTQLVLIIYFILIPACVELVNVAEVPTSTFIAVHYLLKTCDTFILSSS